MTYLADVGGLSPTQSEQLEVALYLADALAEDRFTAPLGFDLAVPAYLRPRGRSSDRPLRRALR